MQKQIARYWAIMEEITTDTHLIGKAVGFGSRVEAERYANNRNEWSDAPWYPDAPLYKVISDFDELLEYCFKCDIGVPEYANQTMETSEPPILFARKCSATGEGMNEGWIVNDGEYYFKYEQDALSHAKEMGYADLDDAYDNEAIYYTEWEDEGDYEYALRNGKLIEL